MSTIWQSSDNKYVAECEVKIQVCEARLLKLEEDIFKYSTEITKAKLKVYALSKTIDYLQDKALVVSFSEFSEIRSELKHFIRKIEIGENRVKQMEESIEEIKSQIEKLEQIKEKVKFKLLKIKVKNGQP